MMAAALAAMTVAELLGSAIGGPIGSTVISDLALDSRDVTPGTAFLALPGERTHGLEHAHEAIERGAAVVLYDAPPAGLAPPAGAIFVGDLRARVAQLARRFYWSGRPQPTLLGVTGTNGKTTVAYLVAQAEQALGHGCLYVGTLGHGHIGSLAAQRLTTPDCLSLHRLLAHGRSESAVIEVSSHALAQQRVAGLEFSVVAVTNLSRDHLDAHGSMDQYARVKAKIVELPGVRTAVLNADDSFARGLTAKLPKGVRPLEVTVHPDRAAFIRAAVRAKGLAGIEMDVQADGSHAQLASPLIGEFNGENLVVALGLLVARGRPLPDACAALSSCLPPPGRMEVLGGRQGQPTVIVDYAHTPAALERALLEIRRLGVESITCVFGCGGDRDRGKRSEMGRAAAHAARVILTDDNPRSEDPAGIVADIRTGLPPQLPVSVEHDRRSAIRQAIAASSSTDVVLIAGKGHEATQIIGGSVRRFDDRLEALAALGDGC